MSSSASWLAWLVPLVPSSNELEKHMMEREKNLHQTGMHWKVPPWSDANQHVFQRRTSAAWGSQSFKYPSAAKKQCRSATLPLGGTYMISLGIVLWNSLCLPWKTSTGFSARNNTKLTVTCMQFLNILKLRQLNIKSKMRNLGWILKTSLGLQKGTQTLVKLQKKK